MIKNIIIVLSVFALISSCAAKKEEEPTADTTAPTSPTITMPASTAGLTVTLALSATDDVGVVAYYLSASYATPSSSSTSWVDVTSAVSYSSVNVSYTLPTTSSSYHRVYVWFKDAAGNVSYSDSDTIYHYPSPPTSPSITINGGAASTNNSGVTLSLSAKDVLDDVPTEVVGVVGYYISDTSSNPTAASDWTPVTSTDNYTNDNVSYTLTGAAGTLKTVYAWFKDVSGNISSVVNDSIMYCSSGTTTMDEVEPNDTLATAMDVCPTSLITGGDSGGVDYNYDYFKVTATSNTMTVSLSHVSALAGTSDFGVSIRNSSDVEIDSFDAQDGVNNGIERWVTSGASYYIRVYHYSAGTNKYTLNTQFSTTSGSLELPTANGTVATAQSLTDSTTMRGERNGSSDSSDYYKITAPSGKTSMNVEFSHDNASASGSDNTIYVYRNIAEGNTPVVSSFSSNNGVDDNRTFGIRAGSEYFILVDVNSLFGSASSGYTRYRYGLRASLGTEVYELEQNDTAATAHSITAGTTYIGGDSGGVDYNYDYFIVTAPSNTMTVSLSHVSALASASDFGVSIRNSSDVEIDSFEAQDGVNNGIELWVTSGQLYYIRVYHYSAGTNKYTLNTQFSTTSGSLELPTANGTVATAQSLTDSTTMRGERNGSSDSSDYYKITAPSGKTSMNVEFSHDNASASGSDNTIYVYRNIAEGNTPVVSSFSSNNGVDDNRTFGIRAGSEYFILVDVNSLFGSASSGYTRYRYGLRASLGTEVYELEQNDTAATAHSITAGTTYIGGDSGGVDYNYDYFIVTATSSTMTVSLDNVTASASGSDFTVSIRNSSDAQIDSFTANNGVDASNSTSVTSGQSYYIRVYHYSAGAYKYKVTASF